jgi:hypothetical protein
LPVGLKTPRSAKSIRHFQLDYQKNPTAAKLQKLFKANKELAVQVVLDKYTKEGLIELLKIEKKSYNRGKRLNLLGKENSSPQLFVAERVRAAQAFQKEKEDKAKAERARIDANKAATAIKKAKDDAAKAERALQAATRKANKAKVDAEEKAEKQAQKQKDAIASKASKDLLAKAKSPAKPRKAPVYKKKVVRFIGSNPEGGVAAVLVKVTKTGCVVKTPVIFEKGK